MLTKPKYGWTNFQLDGTSLYGLSYLDDIAFEWLDQAIHGLETMMPFCVKGFMEPNRFLCTVSYWNCHIICEDDERLPLDENDIKKEYSHTNMLQFCEYLYNDIKSSFDEWILFTGCEDYDDSELENRKRLLKQKLTNLNLLIAENRELFGEHRCFL